ncbi:hypothetical protein [Nonomuraea roseoviolacea]|uniref:SEC-C domain-containing protein n=1 Tax=Nonomuraea roseoviolacea subsp. carminata TaxID=160689 RepID=A0ABT1K165_9ACTN|nr:hypothetical protein [Nonomuraea roseoviolacea]MCP2346774.1 hypothetical protein [Nonomuraea roseoviolacea subsp. carminata]
MDSIDLAAREDDGEKRYLLCGDCEQMLGSAEKYLADICKGGLRRFTKNGIAVARPGTLVGVRKKPITVALLGILFKAQFCDTPPWSNLKFPNEDWIEALREYLVGARPSVEQEAAITAIRYHSTFRPEVNPKAIIIPALSGNGEFYLFEIIIGGWTWLCFFPQSPTMVAREESITSPHNLGPEYADYVLRDGSEWVVLVSDIMANRFLNPSGWEEFSDTDGVVGDAEECSCRMGEARFDQCCKPVWHKHR